MQALYDNDRPRRLEICNRSLAEYERNNQLIGLILFCDEAGFTRDGINLHNSHKYAYENPHSIVETKHHPRFSLNVWAAIIGDYLIGPHFFNGTLNGYSHLDFLRNHLPLYLEDVPLNIRVNMWLLQDGAPPHFSLPVRQYLNTACLGRWIG